MPSLLRRAKRARRKLEADRAAEKTPEPERQRPTDPNMQDEYYREHFREYARDNLRIATKDQGLQPFVLNHTQEVIVSRIEEQRRRGIPPRLIVLKSRQVGVSTVAEGLAFHDAHLNEYRSGLVLAHNQKSSKAIFRMTKRFADNLPWYMRGKRKLDNVNEIHFAETDSRLQVETAGEARGYTAQTVHLSEFAFYGDDRATLQAVLQTVPRSVNSLVIIESTANGVGNGFHTLWLKAMGAYRGDDSLGEDHGIGFVPVFIPWFKHEEYMMQPWFLPAETTQEERVLARTHKLNMRQLAWRRWCIATNCRGEEETFNVEYPATWEEAFLLSGRPVFDKKAMAYFVSQVPPAVPESTLPPRVEVTWDESEQKPVFEEVRGGRLWIFEKPEPRHTYVLGVDPSEGDAKSDPSPIEVLDQMTLNQVAEWHGRLPPDALAEVAMWLGRYYNDGLIINEANNHGVLFHNTVINNDYPSLYYREVDEQSIAGEKTLKPGYWETNRAKHTIFNTFRKFAREKHRLHRDKLIWRLRSPILIGEMGTTIYVKSVQTKTGRQGATFIVPQPGAHYDACIAFGLALIAHRGSEEAPLEPLPEVELQNAATRALLLRERDPEAADRESIDISGMTADQLLAVREAKWRRRMRAERSGTAHMR